MVLWEIEEERAKIRQSNTKLVGKGIQKRDVMVVPESGTAINNGKSIKIAANRAHINHGTLASYKKVMKYGDEEIIKKTMRHGTTRKRRNGSI